MKGPFVNWAGNRDTRSWKTSWRRPGSGIRLIPRVIRTDRTLRQLRTESLTQVSAEPSELQSERRQNQQVQNRGGNQSSKNDDRHRSFDLFACFPGAYGKR